MHILPTCVCVILALALLPLLALLQTLRQSLVSNLTLYVALFIYH